MKATHPLTYLQPGFLEREIGAGRMVDLSGQQHVEELEGLDDRANVL